MKQRIARDVAHDGQAFLSTMAPDAGQRRLAVSILLASAAIFAALVPFAKVPLRPVAAFIPAYQSALVVNDLITAVLLFGQYRILRSRALLALATGYLFTAFMATAHALSFPGLFAPGGLLGAGPQTTAWLYMFWHGGFPCFVLAYALLEDAPSTTESPVGVGSVLLGAVAAALAAAGVLTLVATAGHDALPAIMRESRYTPSMIGVVASVWTLSLLALVVMWRRRSQSLLDLWLMVVMCAWLFDIALSAVLNAGRFDVGFYAGRIYGLLAASFVLVVILFETSRLYGELAMSTNAAQRKAAELKRMSAELRCEAQQRAAALEALHNKEEEIRAVVNNIVDCVISIDSRGIVRGVNPAVERVLGYAEDEVVGRNFSVLLSEPDRSLHDQYIARYRETGEARVTGIGREVTGLHKDGHLIPLELTVSEYRVRGERLFIETLRDIRERKELIDNLTQARADAEQGSRAKSAFLATMSHEIRTPMNGVVGMVELLARTPLSERQSDMVRTVSDSAVALLGIIDDILDFSKIEAGRMKIERAPLCLIELVEGVCQSLAPVADRHGVDVDLFVSPDVPDWVAADSVRVRQVLYNIVGNAIKFSGGRSERRGRVSVRIECASDAPLRVAFRIEDNGIGMPAETVRALFEPFMQGEVSTTRRYGGTGLGLTICKRLVDLMEGEVRVDSRPGEGSTFTIALPFQTAAVQKSVAMVSLAGVDCVVIQRGLSFGAADVAHYLSHAGANVAIVADVAAASVLAATAVRPTVFVHDARAGSRAFADHCHPLADGRLLLLGRPVQPSPRIEPSEATSLITGVLRRDVLLRAVAVAAGRASPEMPRAAPARRFASNEAVPPGIADARACGRLILVAEDDPINQKVILHQLALLGYAAEVAGNGAEALRMWQSGEYALLLTDLHMPEMDGYELTARIRETESARTRKPIVALTANRSGEEIVAAQCSKCHQSGEGGAPRIGEREAWIPRLKNGLDNLVHSAIRGHGGMPARGGMADTTDVEISRAIVYMFDPERSQTVAAAVKTKSAPRSGRRVTAGGMDVYLGITSADRLRAYPTGAVERSMHGGVPRGPGHYHVNVSLFDAGSGIAIDNAQVEVDISQAGTSTGHGQLETMLINNAPSYGSYFDMKPGNSYVVTVYIRRPDVPRRVEAKFQHRAD